METTLRLSEAIRLGAAMKPQAFGKLWDDGGTCAWGAAWDAAGVLNDAMNGRLSLYLSPFDAWLRVADAVKCPVLQCAYPKGLNTVAHLNDFHKWTRERIADFVELHEPMPAPAVQPVAEEELQHANI